MSVIKTYKQFNESYIIEDILNSLEQKNESLDNIKNKLRSYLMKGVLTFSMLTSLLLSTQVKSNNLVTKEIIKTYNELEQETKKKSLSERIEEMKNTKDTDSTYFGYGVGTSIDFEMAESDAIFSARLSILDKVGKDSVIMRLTKRKGEIAVREDGKYKVYILIEVNKKDVE